MTTEDDIQIEEVQGEHFNEEEESPTVLPESPSEMVPLPTGEALSLHEANQIARRVPASVIVLIGPVASGKTTLLSAINECFQRGQLAEFGFAGCHTLTDSTRGVITSE